ncbi:vanadium-dependent haloperoxidase [Streptomyces sp. NPDC032940]|uniref:vanadium-dependent haloperoxidase n=1 Tax=Streptomyces sp. NPDC032940 TaxID=3155366 RepID=UPI00340C42E5
MTTPGRRSPASGLSPRRRSLLLGTAATAALTTLGPTGKAAAGTSARAAAAGFDLDTDNFIKWFQPSDENAGESPSGAIFGPMDATVLLWFNHLTALAWFDAVAPYHPTAVGVHSRIGRRPAGESTTNRNMNIAAIYAQYRLIREVLPQRAADMRQFITSLGLDPDNHSEKPTDAIGIGNLAGKSVFEARKRDGMNFLGDEGGRRYNPLPWADYTGYRPRNTAFELVEPSHWQPQLFQHNNRRVGGGPGDIGIYVAQHFVTPQMGLVKPYTFRHPRQFEVAPPAHSQHSDPRRYKRSVDEILEASAGLTDRQKAVAEVMDNKFWGIGHSALVAARNHDQNNELGVHGWAEFVLAHLLATFESLIVAWYYKAKYDAVRPISAVRHVYGNSKLTAWGGPGKGTVDDIRATEWRSFLPTGDHPEYPSGSSTLCSAAAQAARRHFGDDTLDWKFTFRAGSTLTEPGVTPAKDIELHFPTWTEFTKTCASSRVWAGVHFKKTVEVSTELGEQFGDLAYEFVQRHVRGDVKD